MEADLGIDSCDHGKPDGFGDQRLSGLSSCKFEFLSRVSCFCVENNKQFSRKSNADDHFGLSGVLQPLLEVSDVWIVSGGDLGNEEEDASGSAPPSAQGSQPVPLAAIISNGRQPRKFSDRLVGDQTDFWKFSHEPCDGTRGYALDGAKGTIKAGPKRVLINQRSDLAFQSAALANEKGDDLVETGAGFFIACSMPTLLLHDEIARDLGKPGHQR